MRDASRDVIGVVRDVDSGGRHAQTRPSTQSVQYRSPAGVEYRSLPETEAITKAQAALAADPRNIARIIDLGVAQSGARQFREAIATFTRGLELEPDERRRALLLRWRGHRYLSVREFDRALADLTRGADLDSTLYGIWYHLGIVQFVRGEFYAAAASFARAQRTAPDPGELAGSTDWLWMSLSRAGRQCEKRKRCSIAGPNHDRRPSPTPTRGACSSTVARSARMPCSRRQTPTRSRSPRSPSASATGTSSGATRHRRVRGSNGPSSRADGPASGSFSRKWNCSDFAERARWATVANAAQSEPLPASGAARCRSPTPS